jgi:hypothetical protein
MGDLANEMFMKDFFEEVNAIKNGMNNIRRNIKSIEENYTHSLVSTGIDQNSSTPP